MTTTTEHVFNEEALESLLERGDTPDWLVAQRRDAWDRFGEMAWPQRNEEEWIRTDIRLFKLGKYGPSFECPPELPTCELRLARDVDLAGRSVSVNSCSAETELDPELASRGVLFGSLERLLAEHGDRLRPFFEPERGPFRGGVDRFAALHTAFWKGGALLYVPRGVVVDRPFYAASLATEGGVDLGRTLVILDEGAEATFLAETSSPGVDDGGLHCGSLELSVGAGAHLRFVNLQNWGRGVWHFAHQRARVGRDATLQWTAAALGSRLAKVNQEVALSGPGASCQVNGVLFTEEKQHLSYHTLQHHEAASCRSDFLYKAALQDKSRTVWRGMIKVDPAGQQTDGYQRNDNLLLSNACRADSIPGLEIEADDVRCTHGSTSGRVDEELIFYAQCRGYTRQEAIRLIVTGFFQQVFDRITIDSVRDALSLAIAQRVRDYE